MISGLMEAVQRRFGLRSPGAAAPLDELFDQLKLPDEAVPSARTTPSQRLAVRSSFAPPQPDSEVRPIILELQKLDPLLDILWDAKAVLLEKGAYTVTGRVIDAKYDGRWKVVRHQTANFHPERGDYTVICTLSQPFRQGGILQMEVRGPYAPVGDWVIELLRSADAANVEAFTELRHRLWKQHEAVEDEEGKIDEGAARAALNHVQFRGNYAGGVGNWHPVKAPFFEKP